jgi:4-hydroxybenzoate polyprenyltransferase
MSSNGATSIAIDELPRSRSSTWALVASTRPKQWIKNGLLFLPMLFTLHELRAAKELEARLIRVVVGALLFCLVSGVVYIINDLADLERDRLHPEKRKRPLAAGRVTPRAARLFAWVLFVGGLAGGFTLRPAFGVLLATYFGMTCLYSLSWKHLVLIDVFTMAAGFLLRAVAGAVAIGVPVSPWLYLCTTLGALFIGFSKRRQELVLLGAGAAAHRRVLKAYSRELLDQILTITLSTSIVAYSIYTFTAENLPRNHAMMLTIPILLYGAFRYLYLIHLKSEGGSPEELLYRDRPLLAAVVLWVATTSTILAVFRT